jgi:quinohemoprotein ethanol dehydrogenase
MTLTAHLSRIRSLAVASVITLLLVPLFAYGIPEPASIQAATQAVNTETIPAQSDSNWLSHGRDYREQRFSPLDTINTGNVSQLGLAWSFDTEYKRGLEATPLIVDGVMYVTGNWSVVYALDARTGEQIWKYDPQVPKEWAKMACCDVVNRGVALYEGKVFVGTLDARLVALDASSGKVIWSVQTADTQQYPYTITGAPRVAKGKVFIGNGGAEYGVRGFVSAYDANSGERIWRFYTVPGKPGEGQGTEAEIMAAKTWSGEWWKHGGGGTVWDSIVYDSELDQLYIGVGNGSPWNRRIRSPEGGDNLFLSSIVALNPDTGKYIWHYQETPAETWDYTATQHIMLADMNWKGEQRKVIWHAPKNGFFFIIDRSNGELLSAEPFARVTWASHYDMETGRPVENPGADYSDGSALIYPFPFGAHNWPPMAHHPGTGLVYIPTMEAPYEYKEVEDYIHEWGQWNTGTNEHVMTTGIDLLNKTLLPKLQKGFLLAWDPARQQAAWKIRRDLAWNGGLLATGGNLVFQGTSGEEVVAVNAKTGEELWSFDAHTGVIGSPVTFSVDGEQYVTIAAGWGGGGALMSGVDAVTSPPPSRILTFKLNGEAALPPRQPWPEREQPPARTTTDEARLARGAELYSRYCYGCHGPEAVSNGRIPDLRRLPVGFYNIFDQIVLDGAMKKLGMVGFKDVLSQQDADDLKAYILDEANDAWELQHQSSWWVSVKETLWGWVSSVIAWMANVLL